MTRLEARLRSTERALFARCGVEPTEHIVRAGSAADAPRLRVLTFGTGAPVVCLHAASSFAAHWAPLCARLPARRNISPARRQPKPAPHGTHVPEKSWPLKSDRIRRIQTCCWCGTSEPYEPDKAYAANQKRFDRQKQRWERDMVRLQARLQRIPRPRTKAGASR